MKKILLIAIVAILSFNNAQAQLANGSVAPDFTLVDLEGITHTLYDYLDDGYTVFLDFSAVWCQPCWNYHISGAFEDLYINHGPAGYPNVNANTTDDVMVFFIEGDEGSLADLNGGIGSLGDWVTGTPYPIIPTYPGSNSTQVTSDYQIAYWPTIYQVCPDRLVTECGQWSNPYSLVSACSTGGNGCLPSAGVFWSEDFANGIPSTWTNSNEPWQYRGPSTTPNQNIGSQGAYSGTGDPILSSTAANGFLIFDSDYYDNNGVAGNFGNGQYSVPHIGYITTEIIDLSQYTNVNLQFNSYFRTFEGQAFVEFSTDGGLNFGNAIQVHSNLNVNEASSTSHVVSINLPSVIGGNSNVKIRFVFDGQSNSGYYFWMIDDLKLKETPSCEMNILEVNHGGWYAGYNSTSGIGMDYTAKPLLQSNANPYIFEVFMTNSGAQNQANAQINIEVLDSNNFSVFTSPSTPSSLAVNDTNFFIATQTFSPSQIGVYNMNFYGSSDDIASTDTISMRAIITDTVYARDYNDPYGAWRVGRSCGGMQLGNKFDIYTDDELTSVSAYIADYSVPGANIFGVIYEVDTSSNTFIFLDQSDDYTLQSSDVDGWITIGFDQAITLNTGQQYMVAIGGYAHPTDTFGISTSGYSHPTTSNIQDNGCNLGGQAFGSWYYISNTPMVRMNLGSIIVPTWNCDGQGNCSDPGNGQGNYTSLSDCQSNCIVSPTSTCGSIANPNLINETVIGTTTYDLQSNAAVQNRIVLHDDGTISAVWTMSQALNNSWSDRGTGYNFFDGTNWGMQPFSRLESSRGGWPSIIAMGSGKEASITHNTDNSHINMTHRSATGTGGWTEQNISSIDSNNVPKYLIWNRSVVGGLNKETIHMIAVTASSNLGGLPSNGLDGALVYYRSQDEGVTWDIQDMQLPGMDTSLFSAMKGDAYTITAQGETVVVAYFNDWGDSFIVKSTDNGATWIKTTFLDFPVDKYVIDDGLDLDGDGIYDQVYSTDNYGTVVLDANAQAHVFYGIMMYVDDDLMDLSSSWFPGTNGIAYWNESMGEDITPAIVHAGDTSLWYSDMMGVIVQAPDLDGDGIVGGVDNTGGYALYYNSRASMPSAGISANGEIYLSFSGYTETAHNGSQVFRHLYITKSSDGGSSWSCPVDVTHNPSVMGMKECVFGSMVPTVDDKIRIVYQRDTEPGLSVRGDEDLVDYNDIVYIEIDTVGLFGSSSWDCDGQGNCSDPGNGQGTYTSLSTCQSNCIVVTPTWDCDGQGNCSDPGNGQGTYASLSVCLAAYGCTDSISCNYDPSASCDDGSCLTTYGCMDPAACNYDASANCDDGSCLTVYGCTDQNACNYSSLATCDDGSCNLPNGCGDPLYLEYDILITCSDTSACITLIITGCTDITACNYNTLANVDDGSCVGLLGCTDITACNYDTNATCDDGSCFGLLGCTDISACNYDTNATCDDGSCFGLLGCTDPNAFNYNPSATCDDGSCIAITYDCINGACLDPGNGQGQYSLLNICQASCFSDSWDCINGTCLDPGNGQGQYSSLNICQASCFSASWDCDDQGNCLDPGTGNGTYSILIDCEYICDNVSVEEIGLTNFKIFPNPSSDLFNISFSSNRVQDLRVRVLNSISEEVMIIELNQYKGEYTKQFNLTNNAKGIYFLEIETNDGVINKKLILQ